MMRISSLVNTERPLTISLGVIPEMESDSARVHGVVVENGDPPKSEAGMAGIISFVS